MRTTLSDAATHQALRLMSKPVLFATPAPMHIMGNAEKSDREYWEEQATKANREQLKAVQDSATKWTAVMGTFLGLFSTVAFATGLGAIADLPGSWPTGVRIATSIAFLMILFATWLGGRLPARRAAVRP